MYYESDVKDLLSNLKDNFNVSLDIVESLQSDQNMVLQDAYTEESVYIAEFNSYTEGPIFESINRSDKVAVKNIASHIRPKLEKMLQEKSIRFCKAHRIQSSMMNAVKSGIGVATTVASRSVIGVGTSLIATGSNMMALVKDIKGLITTRAYQILGICAIEPNEINKLISKLNNTFANELNGYKIIPIFVQPEVAGLINYIKTDPYGIEKMFMLIIDKPESKSKKSIEKDQNKIADDINKINSEKSSTKE